MTNQDQSPNKTQFYEESDKEVQPKELIFLGEKRSYRPKFVPAKIWEKLCYRVTYIFLYFFKLFGRQTDFHTDNISTEYFIGNIKNRRRKMIDGKHVYTLKDCDVVIKTFNGKMEGKQASYDGVLRQIETSKLSKSIFYSSVQFNDYIEALRLLKHRNLHSGPIIFLNTHFLPQINFKDVEERLFFVYKSYKGGRMLTELVLDKHNLFAKSLGSVLSMIEQVCEGLACLHSQGLTHGNLTLNNIILFPNGIYQLVDVGFFPVLCKLKPKIELKELVYLHFKPPEFLWADKIFTQEADVWALGIIIYGVYFGAEQAYYFEDIHPVLQYSNDFCLIGMFENYGPFGDDKGMPKMLYTLIAGGIFKPTEERVDIFLILNYVRAIQYNQKKQEYEMTNLNLLNDFEKNIVPVDVKAKVERQNKIGDLFVECLGFDLAKVLADEQGNCLKC
uniref:Protein kinase domain-containing protein n=1 Tax=Rhabditophanes sp. KR3021 TaxID=114890 RepID=A0AC35TUP7_9BILA